MFRKIKEIISLIKNDSKNYHNIEINKYYIKKNFNFSKSSRKLSDNSVERIFLFSKKLINQDKKINKNDLWKPITSQKDHQDLLKSCIKNDLKKFNKIMNLGNKTKLTQGFLNYCDYEDLMFSNKKRYKESEQFIDKLISLAEYKKLTAVFNPEQGKWVVKNNDYIKLIDKVFSIKNKKIKPFISPNYTFGLKANNLFYSIKDIKSLYTSLRIKELSKKNKFIQINEIGAGLGYLPFYSSKMNNIYHNVFDLPFVLILQSYYLMISLGEDKVHLYGEKKKTSHIISLNPYWSIFNANIRNVLWINQDSLPEIDKKLSEKYLKKIFSSKKSYFLSINQEAKAKNFIKSIQHPVHELIDKNVKKNIIYRSRDFLRKGYIEELYYIK